MTISGCPGGIARGRNPHGAAQQSGVDDGRQAASAAARRAALDGENAVQR